MSKPKVDITSALPPSDYIFLSFINKFVCSFVQKWHHLSHICSATYSNTLECVPQSAQTMPVPVFLVDFSYNFVQAVAVWISLFVTSLTAKGFLLHATMQTDSEFYCSKTKGSYCWRIRNKKKTVSLLLGFALETSNARGGCSTLRPCNQQPLPPQNSHINMSVH